MKQLSTHEQKWIARRLGIYRIRYAEIYDEIYDHLVSACEEKRATGDTRPILSLFQETMDQDMGSHRGIEQTTQTRMEELRGLIAGEIKTGWKKYLSGRELAVLFLTWGLVFLVSYFLHISVKGLLIGIFMLGILPMVYMLVYGTRHRFFRMVWSKRKTSLVNHTMSTLLGRPLLTLYIFLFALPNLLDLFRPGVELYQSSRHLIEILGITGMSLLFALMTVYCRVTIEVLHTTYKHMARQVSI